MGKSVRLSHGGVEIKFKKSKLGCLDCDLANKCSNLLCSALEITGHKAVIGEREPHESLFVYEGEKIPIKKLTDVSCFQVCRFVDLCFAHDISLCEDLQVKGFYFQQESESSTY